MSVASVTLADSPVTFASVTTHIATAPWVFPTNSAQTKRRFPYSNTRQIVILNTGGNPLLLGFLPILTQAVLPSFAVTGLGIPYAFEPAAFPLAAGGPIVPVEGDNCTRIPVGGSFSLDLLPFQERGNFFPIVGLTGSLQASAYPLYLMFFAPVGADTTADITYVNKLGLF